MLSDPLKIVICLALFLLNFFLLPKTALYEDIETCFSANKAPLFHARLGSPASLFSSTPVPRSQSTKTMTLIDMSLSKLQEIVNNREAWHAEVHVVAKSWKRLSD